MLDRVNLSREKERRGEGESWQEGWDSILRKLVREGLHEKTIFE